MGIFDGVLLAADVDGTLINSCGKVTDPVREALLSFCGRGGRFTVATGRSFAGFAALRPAIPLNAPAILSNGAYIYDYETQTVLHSEWLSGPYREAVADIRAAFPSIGTELHWPDHVCILNYNKWNELHMDAVQCQFKRIDTLDLAPGSWLKALFVDENALLRQVAAYAAPKYAGVFSFFFSTECMLEMQNAGVDKAGGVHTLAELLSIDPAHVYTAGDAGNDLGMLRSFTSFAPVSATPEARAAATHIVPSNDDHAIAAAVRLLEKIYGSSARRI